MPKSELEKNLFEQELSVVKTLTVDAHKRIRLPDASPHTVFSYEPTEGGRILLVPVERVEPKSARTRFEKRGKYSVLVSDQPVNEAALKIVTD